MDPVVLVTTFFPNPSDPHRAVFVRNLARALSAQVPLRVVSPVALVPLPGAMRRLAVVPRAARLIDGLEVSHPRYLSIPGLFPLAGVFYALGVLPTLRALRREHPRMVVHAHCAYPDGVGAMLAARWLGLRCVITAHGSDLNVHAQRAAFRPQVAWALARARAVIAVSSALRDRALALLGGRGRVEHIPCAAVDGAVFRPRDRTAARAALGLPADTDRVVLFVGQLLPIKAPAVLAQAWRALRAAGRLRDGDRLVFVGEGGEAARLQGGPEADGVRLVGARPQAEVALWMSAADLLCLPSLNEGTPNVIVEAMACGTPVVATRVGGVPELVRDGENGHLVPAGDASALADGLARALERGWDPDSVRASVAGLRWDAIAARNADVLRAVAAA